MGNEIYCTLGLGSGRCHESVCFGRSKRRRDYAWIVLDDHCRCISKCGTNMAEPGSTSFIHCCALGTGCVFVRALYELHCSFLFWANHHSVVFIISHDREFIAGLSNPIITIGYSEKPRTW